MKKAGPFDFLIECSAEPSVLAGKDGKTDYLINTNFNGAINCAELCRKNNAGMIFLSTSRVYPIAPILNSKFGETPKRFEILPRQNVNGLSKYGIRENFPIDGPRSLYGATKYAAEIMLEEYRDLFGLPLIINRSGVIAGPWQFGKVDQGIAAFWTAAHLWEKPLKYIGFGGKGKQVRDFLHIDDLVEIVKIQLKNPAKFAKGIFNIGGGLKNSVSLIELTEICQNVTGHTVPISSEPETRYADIPIYISDIRKINKHCGWKPQKTVINIIEDIYNWLNTSPKTKAIINSIENKKG